jgi:VWFA-related protein
MNTARLFNADRGRKIIACLLICLIGFLPLANGQQGPPAPSPEAGGSERGFKIRVGVEEVRLDAVVLGKDGRQVTDLTGDDFEVFQDHFRQKVTSCVYINDYRPMPPKPADPSDRTGAPIPVPVPTRRNVRRTIVFVVDNLVMNFTQVHRARLALGRFVDAQMQDGDLVAILPTAGGDSTFQTFSADRRQLHGTIGNIRWHIDWRTTPTSSQLMALAYSIRTLRDMPGRKSVVMISPATMIPSPFITKIGVWLNNTQRAVEYTSNTFNPLADAALRAGVVIHTLDIRGLSGPFSVDAELGFDYSFLTPDGTLDPGEVSKKASNEVAVRDSSTPIPLSEKTGGVFIRDSNWFVNGIGPVQEEMKGYYMLTYAPPPTTFRTEFRNLYHRVQIKVKRFGCEVHARDGFYGVSQPEIAPAGISNSLHAAIFSPFQYDDVKVHLASGYIDDPQKGYLLRSFLHLDARDLTITDGKEGTGTIEIEAASVTVDTNNLIKDSSAYRYEFEVKKEDIPWVREHGIRFSLALPIKRPGAYYVRTAVRDPASGKMGSAYQYIEIPDLKKSRLALSDIFVVNRGEDVPWAPSLAPMKYRQALYPDLRRDARRSPALRDYLPGENFECATMIYNAKIEKGKKPDLESRFTLYGNGKELFKSEPETVDLGNVGDFTRIPLKISLKLADSLPPGDYVLLLQVTDRQANKKYNLASQTLSFKALTN